MKRFLLAAGIAVAIHVFFLGTDPGWLKKMSLHRPETRVVTMTLAYLKPPRPEPKPVVQGPKIPVKRPKPVVEKKKQTPVHKPEPPKKISAPITPIKISPSPEDVTIPEQVPDTVHVSKPEPQPEPELADINKNSLGDLPDLKQEILEEEAPGTGDRVEPAPPLRVAHTIREARPIYQNNPPPEYPRLARRRGYEGTVVLEVLVDQEGRVEDLRLFRSSKHKILDRAAMASVKEWLFEPGMRGDKPVEMWVRIPIRFQLK